MATTPHTDTKAERDSLVGRFGVMSRMLFGSLIIIGLVGGIGGWAATAELSGAVIAQGTVVVDKNIKRIQHRDGGIVSRINVKNGDSVSAGQVIIELDDTQIRAELAILETQIVELTARKSRLFAEANGSKKVTFPPGFVEQGIRAAFVATGEQRLFEKVRTNIASQQDQMRLQINQFEEEIEGIEAQRKGKAGQLELIEKELSQIQELYNMKLTSVTRLYAMQREQKRLIGEYGDLIAQKARTKAKISEIRMQLLHADQTAGLQAQRDLQITEAKVAELLERELAVTDRLRRTKLIAPQAGTVHELAFHTIGGVIAPAETVVMIVPQNEALTVEARFASVDIDQVVIGRKTRLRFSSFNQRTTPELEGRIMHVGANVIADPKTAQQYYIARVAIDGASLAKLKGLDLVPGMPVEVFTSTGARTALSYLSKPITDQFNRAFREE